MMKVKLSVSTISAVFLAFIISGCVGMAAKKPNIIVISIDTLRADTMQLYGGPAKTPNLIEFAKENIWFRQSTANGNWTRSSFQAIWTGRYASTPSPTGKKDSRIAGKKNDEGKNWMDNSFITMSDIMKSNGYHTVGFTTNPVLQPENNFQQGFDEYHTSLDQDLVKLAPVDDSGEAITTWISRWLTKNSKLKEPLFAWFHYMDPHAPFNPPAEFADKWVNKKYEGIFRKNPTAAISHFKQNIGKKPTEADKEAAYGFYCAEVEYVDKWVGNLLDKLKAADLYDDSIIVIVSDHGEEIFEHIDLPISVQKRYGKAPSGHGNYHYNTLNWTPLLLHIPGIKAREVPGIGTQIDILPTVIEAAGLKVPENHKFDGISLVNAAKGKDNLSDRVVFTEDQVSKSKTISARNMTHKLIYYMESGKYEFYNLREDPKELNDIAGKGGKAEQELLNDVKKFINR